MPLLPNNREHGWAPYVWLVFLSFFFFQPILNHAGLTEWLITIAATLVFGAMYFAIFWTPPRAAYGLLAGMAALGIGLARFNQGSCVFIIFCASGAHTIVDHREIHAGWKVGGKISGKSQARNCRH